MQTAFRTIDGTRVRHAERKRSGARAILLTSPWPESVRAFAPTWETLAVARAENQAEAEFLQGLLEAEGVVSSLRRSPGFDVPDFLAAGPRDVLVRASAERFARDALLQGRERSR